MAAELYAEQVRAARAMLGWTQPQLAEHAGISVKAVRRIEAKNGPLGSHSYEIIVSLRTAMVEAGIQFSNQGGPGVFMLGDRAADPASNLNAILTPPDYSIGQPLPLQQGEGIRRAIYIGPYLPDFVGTFEKKIAAQESYDAKECLRIVYLMQGLASMLSMTANSLAPVGDIKNFELLVMDRNRLNSTVECILAGKTNPLFNGIDEVRRGFANRPPAATTTELFRATVGNLLLFMVGARWPDPSTKRSGVSTSSKELSQIVTKHASRGYISGDTIEGWARDKNDGAKTGYLSSEEIRFWTEAGRSRAAQTGEKEAIKYIKALARGIFAREDPLYGINSPEVLENLRNVTRRTPSNGST